MLNSNVSGRMASSLYFLVVTATLLFPGKAFTADAGKEAATAAVPRKRSSLHPHCGLYCVYTLLELANREVSFRDLVKPKYLGSSKGSSMVELKSAAQDYGLYVVPADKLSFRELRSSPYPIILHVKSNLESQKYDHYELFLGMENGKPKLFSPPDPVRSVPFRELAPRWDGNGLIVSAEPIDVGLVFDPGRRLLLFYVTTAIAGIFVVHVAKRWLPGAILYSRRKQFGVSVAQSAAFTIVA